jgi:acyl-CoA synthetase (AMP-forming)/AMP-acid ligase II
LNRPGPKTIIERRQYLVPAVNECSDLRVPLNLLSGVHDLARDQSWSGPDIAAEVRRRARLIAGLLEPGQNACVIAHGNSPTFFADLFAVWEAGGIAVCVNPNLTADELVNVVDFVNARCVLVSDNQPTAGVNGVPVLCSARERLLAETADELPTGLDDPALILFTSGTTGDPKGVVHTHRSILARVALNQAHIAPAVLTRTLCVLPTHFGHGLIGNCLTPILAGGELFLMQGAGVAGAQALGPVIERHRISFMSSVPAYWKLALRVSNSPAPGTLRQVHIGSAPLSAELWREVIDWCGTTAVANMYGTTETANWIGGALGSELPPEDGLLGRPWGGNFGILSDDGVVRSKGDGEVLVQTPSLMQGYYRRSDLAREVLRNGWYRTGDRGHVDADGVLRLAGRINYSINRGGIKVYPEELDLLLERHPEVSEACTFAVPDPVSGDGVAVAVRLRDDAAVAPRELIDWVRQRIRPEAVPNRVYPLSEIPKTGHGKVDRNRVAAHCLKVDRDKRREPDPVSGSPP